MYAITDEARNALRPASPWRLRAMARQMNRADAAPGADREHAYDMAGRAYVRLNDRDRARLREFLHTGP